MGFTRGIISRCSGIPDLGGTDIDRLVPPPGCITEGQGQGFHHPRAQRRPAIDRRYDIHRSLLDPNVASSADNSITPPTIHLAILGCLMDIPMSLANGRCFYDDLFGVSETRTR